TAQDKNFSVSASRLADWVTFQKVDQDQENPVVANATLIRPIADALAEAPEELGLPSLSQKTLRATLDRQSVGQYVPEVAGAVDHPPENARLGFTDGHIVVTGEAKDGLVVDRSAAVTAITNGAATEAHTAELPI